jgi:hypothetical protein
MAKTSSVTPTLNSQVSYNIIMSSRRVKLSLRNILLYVAGTCGRIGKEGEWGGVKGQEGKC